VCSRDSPFIFGIVSGEFVCRFGKDHWLSGKHSDCRNTLEFLMDASARRKNLQEGERESCGEVREPGG